MERLNNTVPHTLRPATNGDQAFLLQVYGGTRAEELRPLNWSPQQIQSFIQMQFAAQANHYRNYFPNAEQSILLHHDIPVGRLYLDASGHELCILDIALLPQYRNMGIGSYWLNQVINTATRAQKPVRIHVERHNPALHLYQRLGFQILEQGEVYHLMERALPSQEQQQALA